MAKIGRQPGLNASCCAMDNVLASHRLNRNVENCARNNSAFSGTLWGISHD
jgi:hypothetical protein